MSESPYYAFLASDRGYYSKSAWEKIVRANIPVGDKWKWRYVELTPVGATREFTVHRFIDVTGRGDSAWTHGTALFQIIDVDIARLVHHRLALDSSIRPYFFKLSDDEQATLERFVVLAGILFEGPLRPTIRSDLNAYKITVPHNLRSVFGEPPTRTLAPAATVTLSKSGKLAAASEWIDNILYPESVKVTFKALTTAMVVEHEKHLDKIDEIYFAPLRVEFNKMIKWVTTPA